MGLRCKVSFDRNGKVTVRDDKGSESRLFNELMDLTDNQETSLNAWAAAYTEDFDNRGEEVSVNELIRYFEANKAQNSRLSESEIAEVKDYMIRNGIESLSDLYQTMVSIFKPDGILRLNSRAAIASELFSQQELRDIDPVMISKLISKIEGTLSFDDFTVEPGIQDIYYKHEENKNIFGAKERVSHKEVDEQLLSIIRQPVNANTLASAINSLPYEELSERYENDSNFAKALLDRVSKVKTITELSLIGQGLSARNNHHYTKIKNTMLEGIDTTALETDLGFLVDISPSVWHSNHDQMIKVLKEIEVELSNYGIDAIGLSDKVHFREDILQLVGSAIDLLNETSVDNLEQLASSMDKLIDKPDNIRNRIVDEKYSDYNIVEFHTNLDPTTVFNRYGLIKISDSLYHKVQREVDVNVVKDAIYNKVLEGSLKLPSRYLKGVDVDNKVATLEVITSYLNSKDTPVDSSAQEVYAGYQVLFDHNKPEDQTKNLKYLNSISTDTTYLKTQFITDFHKYIMEEKFKNSPLYRNTLSKFTINDADIVMISRIDSIEGIKYEKELSDYIALKRDSSMDYLLKPSINTLNQDSEVLNFPEKAPELTGKYQIIDEYIVSEESSNLYVRYNKELYRKALSKSGVELYAKVNLLQNTLYYTTSDNFSFNKTEAKRILNRHGGFGKKISTTDSVNSIIDKSNISPNISVESYSIILDSGLEVLPLYSENELDNINERIDECAG